MLSQTAVAQSYFNPPSPPYRHSSSSLHSTSLHFTSLHFTSLHFLHAHPLCYPVNVKYSLRSISLRSHNHLNLSRFRHMSPSSNAHPLLSPLIHPTHPNILHSNILVLSSHTPPKVISYSTHIFLIFPTNQSYSINPPLTHPSHPILTHPTPFTPYSLLPPPTHSSHISSLTHSTHPYSIIPSPTHLLLSRSGRSMMFDTPMRSSPHSLRTLQSKKLYTTCSSAVIKKSNSSIRQAIGRLICFSCLKSASCEEKKSDSCLSATLDEQNSPDKDLHNSV